MIFLNILENIYIKKGIFAKYSYRQSWRKKRCKMLTLFFQCLLSPFPQLLFVPWINFTVIRPFIQFLEATKYNLYYRELSPPIGKSHITGGVEPCLKIFSFKTKMVWNLKLSQELQMLSSVTLNSHVTKIVMNSGSQLSEL